MSCSSGATCSDGDVTIPIGQFERVATDSIRVGLTKDEVARLPAVPVHRWVARLTGGALPPRSAA
jgi:hypothetical protein